MKHSRSRAEHHHRPTTPPPKVQARAEPLLWREAWASHLVAEAAMVEAALCQAESDTSHLTAFDAATIAETRHLLTRAVDAATRGPTGSAAS